MCGVRGVWGCVEGGMSGAHEKARIFRVGLWGCELVQRRRRRLRHSSPAPSRAVEPGAGVTARL